MVKCNLKFESKVKYILSFLAVVAHMVLYAQFGGDHTYSFVNTINSAKIGSIGGENVSLKGNDIAFFAQNPSLLDSTAIGNASVSWGSYGVTQSGVFAGNIFYGAKIKNQNIGFGIKSVNYGYFMSRDEENNRTGMELATDQVLYIGWSMPIKEKISVGATVKPVYSYIASYTSLGILFDAGASYTDTSKLLTVGVTMRNLGTQIKPYTANNFEPIPFEIVVGATKKLRHAPLRFTASYKNIQAFNLRYPVEKKKNILNISGEEPEEKNWEVFGDKFIRHFVVGAELLLTENLYGAIGYNFRMRKELSLEDKKGKVGFSYGLGFKLSRFKFQYGCTVYNLAGSANFVTINTNFGDKQKSNIPEQD